MIADLLELGPVVVNIGVAGFAEAVADQGGEVEDVAWTPPRSVDPEMEHLLEELL